MDRLDQYITIADAANEADVSLDTIRRWIVRDGVELFTQGDRRRRLIRREDLDRLVAPRPMAPPRELSQVAH